MNIKNKLKIEKFNNINLVNFPSDINFDIKSVSNNIEVIIYYVKEIDDVENFVRLCESINLSKDNRVILVYKKGDKNVNRDIIISPFREEGYSGFKFKAPILCSISTELSAFVMSYESL